MEMPFPNPIQMIRNGSHHGARKPIRLKAGPLDLHYQNGSIKYIKLGSREMVREIYAAVRDKNWGTIEPNIQNLKISKTDDSFSISFSSEHHNEEVSFCWIGLIEGTQDGVITFKMDGVAKRTFLRNRIGFCVLHPMELAGSPIQVETPNDVMKGTFPKYISPHQPFFDIVAIQQEIQPGVKAELRFEGELFEMEDQRNWTDASFKTYCTPLRVPFPVEIKEGERVSQTITLKLSNVGSKQGSSDDSSTPTKLRISQESLGKLPALGLVNNKGFSPKEFDLLRALHLSHLHVDLNLQDEAWKEQLRLCANKARSLHATLELEVNGADIEEELKKLMSLIKEEEMDVRRLTPYASNEFVSSQELLEKARGWAGELRLTVHIGGGTRANFTELNRAKLPLDQMDIASYTINPQIHAFDDVSIMETLPAQKATVESTVNIIGNKPVVVGPITLKPRVNPYATSKEESRKNNSGVPLNADSRQTSLFCAAWTLGSIHQLAASGVDAITYYETSGYLGVMEKNGDFTYPVYHVFADIGEYRDAELVRLVLSHVYKVEALALRNGSKMRLLIANLVDDEQRVTIQTPFFKPGRARVLDETTVIRAMVESEDFRKQFSIIGGDSNQIELCLKPYAIGCIDFDL